jgi:hypothetical protein
MANIDPLGFNKRLDEMDETIDETRSTQPEPEDGRMEGLPEHERDDPRTIGGGIASAGGTSIDRGTGTLDGRAENEELADDANEGGGSWTG